MKCIHVFKLSKDFKKLKFGKIVSVLVNNNNNYYYSWFMVSLCELSYGCNWELAKHLISLSCTQQHVTLRFLLCFITSCLHCQLETCSINMKQLYQVIIRPCCMLLFFHSPEVQQTWWHSVFPLLDSKPLHQGQQAVNQQKNSNDQTLSCLTQSHYWRTEKGSNLFPQTLHSSWNTACWIIFLLFNPPAISSKSIADLLTMRNSSHHQLVLDSGGVRVGM